MRRGAFHAHRRSRSGDEVRDEPRMRRCGDYRVQEHSGDRRSHRADESADEPLSARFMEWFQDEEFWRELYPYMFPPERFAAAPEQVDQVLALTGCNEGKVLDL